MKMTYLRGCLRWFCRFLVLWTLCLVPIPDVRAADGDLDLTFEPDAAFGPGSRSLAVLDGRVYFQTIGNPIQRLHEDGGLDADWSLPVLGFTVPGGFNRTPWGDFLVRDISTVYRYDDSGERVRLGSVFHNPGAMFPQDDGSVVVVGPVSRFTREGERDPRFGNESALMSAPFSDGAGNTRIGGPSVKAVRDGQGRLIVGGNIGRVGELDRAGLARILADGTPDPSWNPAPALGMELAESGSLTAMPFALAAGPEDSVVVGLRHISTDGEPNLHFAVIDADGNVTSTFANPGLLQPLDPLLQPDGRILLGGTLASVEDSPIPALLRLNPDGSIDPTFEVEVNSESGSAFIYNLMLDDHGRLYCDGVFDAVNGVPRNGFARVFAYDPAASAPSIEVAVHQPRIATNEVLYLTAVVSGHPPPALQWYLDGVALTGQTNRGLRVEITDASHVGNYSLVAGNDTGVEEITFPTVELAARSPRPGTPDPAFNQPLAPFIRVAHLLPLPNGSILVGGGDANSMTVGPRAMVGRLHSDGTLDTTFGEDGIVSGDGLVESLRLLPDDGILVAGRFTELAGTPAHGLAELTADGRLVPRGFPALDQAHVSTALRLPDGRTVIAGRFSEVNGTPAHRLVRLNVDLSLDPSFTSPLEPWHFVDDLRLDAEGRLLVAGERIYVLENMTNPSHTGLLRLLEDGSPDPEFQAVTGAVRKVIVEPADTLIAAPSPRRVDPQGNVIAGFEQEPGTGTSPYRAFDADHRIVRLPDGSVVAPWESPGGPNARFELIRWHANGQRDYRFESLVGTNSRGPRIQAVACLPDGALLVSTLLFGTVDETPPPEEARRLMRIPVDSDTRFRVMGVWDDEFRVQLATQPGRVYEIRRRTRLGAGESTRVATLDGDGYILDISIPAEESVQFLELHRE